MSGSDYLRVDESQMVSYGGGQDYEVVSATTALGPVELILSGEHVYIKSVSAEHKSIPLVLGRKKLALGGALSLEGHWATEGSNAPYVSPWGLFGRISEVEKLQALELVRTSVLAFLDEIPQKVNRGRITAARAKARVLAERADMADREAIESAQVAAELRAEAVAALKLMDDLLHN